MLNLDDILNKEPQKVSKKFEDYTNLIYGDAKIGKSTLNAELFKNNGFFIFGEPRFRHLEGIKVQQVNSWSDFMQVVGLFKKNKTQLQKVYPNIIISGCENLLRWCKDYTLSHFKVNDLNAVAYGQAHSFYFDMWQKYITMLSNEGYKVHFELHATKETVRVPYDGMLASELEGKEIKYDKKSGEQYVEFEKFSPDMKPKFLNPILNIVDNILYLSVTSDTAGEQKRCIHLRESLYWKAGITFKDDNIPSVINLGAKELRDTFNKAIGQYENTEEEEQKAPEKTPFEDIKKEIGNLGIQLCKKGDKEGLTKVIEKYLGEGAKVNEATEEDYEQCIMILSELKGLV